jgi:hypothetical protein
MLPPKLLAMLRDYWKRTHPGEWLFPGDRPGQPITPSTIDRTCRDVAETIVALFSPTTLPRERMRLLRRTEWWPHVVEALYRGEYAASKTAAVKSPAEAAERSAAACLGISESLVHKLCECVRRARKRHDAEPEWEPLTVAEFETWKQHGGDLGTDPASTSLD